jgi:tetratricopeptide (TPR) repeat protein
LADRFQKLQALLPSLANLELRALFLNELGQWQTQNGQYSDAASSLHQAEEYFAKSASPLGVAAVLANRGQFFMAQKNYDAAEREWDRALVSYEMLAEPEGIARALAGKGRALLLANRDLPVAEDCLARAAHNYHTLGKLEEQVVVLDALLLCLTSESKPLKPVQEDLAQAHDDLAAVYENVGNLAGAREQWEASAALWATLQKPAAQQRALEGVKRASPHPPP